MIKISKLLVVLFVGAALLSPLTARMGRAADPTNGGYPVYPPAAKPQACSGGWIITGYYLPVESDFDNFDDFMSEVVMQGSGRLNDGSYINWQGYLVDQPLTTAGVPVQEGMVAFDARYFPFGTTFWVNGQAYVGTDTGAAILGRHLDVFTGYGKDAQQRAFDLTIFNQTVCWAAPR